MKKITNEDKTLIKAYFIWNRKKYECSPTEYECSKLINNMNSDHRDLVENYLSELQLKIVDKQN